MTSFVTEGWFPAAPYEAGVRGSRTTVEQLGRTSHGGGGGGVLPYMGYIGMCRCEGRVWFFLSPGGTEDFRGDH